MKLIKIVVCFCLFLFVLGCTSENEQPICTKTCPSNRVLNVDSCRCEKAPCTTTCAAGLVLNQETCSCEKEPCNITCEEGFTKNEETCACDENQVTQSAPLCEGIVQPTPKMLSNASESEINAKCGVFVEENGLLIMEAENTSSDYSAADNKWVFKNEATTVVASGFNKSNCDIVSKEITDHKGSGYLYFNSGDYWSVWSDPNELDTFRENNSLTYTFKIKNTGNYRLFLRALKAIDDRENDPCRSDSFNDCFIKMEGDFGAGEVYSSAECVNTNGYVAATKYMLSDFKKFFGASNQKWTTTGKLDNHNTKPWAIYEFKAGQTYTLTITGRSKNYMIDRIMLVDLHKYNYNQFNNYLHNAVQNSCE